MQAEGEQSAGGRADRSDGRIGTRIGRRRPRMSEQQTRSLMLGTAIEAIQETGLTVSLEHISMEDVIRESGVSRTAAYRCWPQKELFIGDLILELARTAIPVTNTRGGQATGLLKAMLLDRLDDLTTPEARQTLVAELVTTAIFHDFQDNAADTARWRTYIALVATVMNLPDGDLRDQVRQALAESELQYRDRLCDNYRVIVPLLGLRLVDPENIPMEKVAELVIAMTRGLVLQDQVTGSMGLADLPEDEMRLSLPALGYMAILVRCFEIDPDVTWDADRAETLRATLSRADDLFAPARPPT